jgi:hypothetical protein
VWDDDRRPLDERWHDNQGLVWASGVAGLVLIGVLVYAVVQVSQSSVDAPDIRYPDTPTSTVETSYTTPTTTTTSYLPPNVQTSEINPGPAAPPPDAPTDGGDTAGPGDTPTTPTTIYNPYAPTTTTGSAGHV